MQAKDIKYRLTSDYRSHRGIMGADKDGTGQDPESHNVPGGPARAVRYPSILRCLTVASSLFSKIRRFLTAELQDLPLRSKLSGHLRAMRASCRKFLDMLPDGRVPQMAFLTSLGAVRGVLGLHLAVIAAQYELDVENELSSIFPIGDAA